MTRILLLCLLAVAAPVNQAVAAASRGAHPAAERPAAAQAGRLSDAQIESIIRAKLAKSKIGKDGFQVSVKNGIATWRGSTGVIQHKGAATRMARTAGAVQVVNNIQISDAARQKAVGQLRRATVHTN